MLSHWSRSRSIPLGGLVEGYHDRGAAAPVIGTGWPASRARGRLGHRWLVSALVAVLTLLALDGMAVADAGFPDPPPDFPVLDAPHHALFSPHGGQTDRAMLVIFAEFADITFDDVGDQVSTLYPEHAEIDAAYLHDRFFRDGFPSAADYFDDISRGQLRLAPATESNTGQNGAADDGVVAVTVDEDYEDFIGRGRTEALRILLELADPDVDYSQFDKDDDGVIRQDELILVRQDVSPDPVPVGSATAQRPDPVELDGVELGGAGGAWDNDRLVAVDAGTATNLMTLVHEVGHAAFDMPDTRINNDVGRYDLGAGTSNLLDAVLFRSSAWQAIHLGWAEPTVVTQSGYYEVPASPLGDPFVLYDPTRGTDEYFLVENRVGESDHYDQGLVDIGLVVWRVDERNYHPVGAEGEYLSLTRPDDGSATFSPGVDPGDPQRTLDGATWLDGTEADIAIRAISPVDDVMRVYFDVPGPGILVDPLTHVSGGFPIQHAVTPEVANPVRVPVMNTGAETDDFSIDFADLPEGWSSNADEVELDGGEEADSAPELVPAADAETGVHEVTVVGESTADSSVRSEATLEVEVVLDAIDVTYTGATEGRPGEPTEFSAKVTNIDDDDAPVVGVEVTFEVDGVFVDDSASFTAITDADGVATTNPVVDLAPGDYDIRAVTERFGRHRPGVDRADYRVLTAAERVEQLRDSVTDADLHHGIERSLTAKLEAALASLDADDSDSACDELQAFANQVEALRGRHVPEDSAETWLHETQSIRAQLDCSG